MQVLRVKFLRFLVLGAICCVIWSQTTSPSGEQTTAATQTTTPQSTSSSSPPSSGQTQSDTPTAAPDPPPLTFAGIHFAGMVDGYYGWNDNHPASGFNQLYNFNDKTDQWDLNLLKLTASRDPEPIGFRVDIGLGRAFDIIHTQKPSPEFFDYVEQAYVSLKPKQWKGFEADFGNFVTSAGAEVIETKDNWNYSRSLLFALAIPYYHFGVRTSMPIGSSLTMGLQVVDGWNAIVNQYGNNMQTVGLTGAITRKKFTWSHNFYVGPEYTGTNSQNRTLYDTTLLLTPSDRINAYVNYDYGEQHLAPYGHAHWTGVAGALHFQINKRFAVSPRVEYYNDSSGYTTGTAQKLHEITLTGEYKVIDAFLARLEYRHDGSNVPYFTRGATSTLSQTQSTVTVGFIAFYPAKHQ
jgi:Putative beta-barrel porin-2, OmpL-like. bbp2